MVEELLKETIARFNKKAAEDPNLRAELQNIRKTIQVEITDGELYNFVLENAHVSELNKGPAQNPDIRIIASKETIHQLRSGELRVMKAYATRRLQVKGSMEDLLRLRKFF
ncbi:MAG: SCP2 sterol-binding domain-containing protein [Thermoplasmata archaeon]